MATVSLNDEPSSFCNTSWNRLRTVVIACKARESQLEELQEHFSENSSLNDNILVSNMVNEVDERNLRINGLKKRIEVMQKMFLAKKRNLHEINEKIKKKEVDMKTVEDKAATSGEKSNISETKITKLRRILFIYCRLLAVRRITMVQDIIDLFKIEIDGGPASRKAPVEKRDCNCVLFDTIRNIHLPHSDSILGHSENETFAAIGYVVQALNAICTVLQYEFRYPLISSSSFSKIYHPLDNKTLTLYGWRKRLDRDRFIEAILCLGKNIAQLRADCGIPTPVADKTLSILCDWVRSISGGTYVRTYMRPVENVQSPASLLVPMKL